MAKVGVSSAWILLHAPVGYYDTVYLSSGSNDSYNHELVYNLKHTRAKYITANRFVWIMPVNGVARNAVQQAAFKGDKEVYFIPGHDHVHPVSYYQLKNNIK